MKAKFLFFIFVCFLYSTEIFAFEADTTLLGDSIQVSDNLIQPVDSSINHEFGPEYEKILNRADWAYRVGLFNIAIREFKKAYEINPKSLYIQYKIREIENTKHDLESVVLYFNFDKPDILIKTLIYFIVYFIISLLFILSVILINRGIIDHDKKLKDSFLEKYQQLLVDYLFAGEDNKEILNSIRNIAASSFSRKILIDQMIDLSINLTGEAKEKLQNLYFLLKLDKDSINKAYNRKWYIKVKGFQELAFMNIPNANDEIINSLHSYNDIVRMEAQLAMVRLNHDDPFGFLDLLEKPFTLWEQLTVYETIMFHNLPIPQFDRWLFSKNKSVVMFSLRMIDIYKQMETYKNLFWMLVNDDEEIRQFTIHVLGNLKIKDALHHLKRLYKGETYVNKITILQAFAKIPDDSVLNFLKLVIDKEDDVQLQIEAAIAIHNMGETGKITLQKLMNSDYKNYQIIIKHVLDKRIN